jgi:hypothetical protein
MPCCPVVAADAWLTLFRPDRSLIVDGLSGNAARLTIETLSLFGTSE